MGHYLTPSDPTRRSGLSLAGELITAGGVGGLVSLALAEVVGTVPPPGWGIAGALALVGLSLLLSDWLRQRHADARAWETEQWEHFRDEEYEKRGGIFLTHSLAPYRHPTDDTREWWTATIQLVQHRSGPLSQGKVKEVVYSFGSNFEEGPSTRQNSEDNFRYETRLHGSVLVLGRVYFKSRLKRPLVVERYIDVPRA